MIYCKLSKTAWLLLIIPEGNYDWASVIYSTKRADHVSLCILMSITKVSVFMESFHFSLGNIVNGGLTITITHNFGITLCWLVI